MGSRKGIWSKESSGLTVPVYPVELADRRISEKAKLLRLFYKLATGSHDICWWSQAEIAEFFGWTVRTVQRIQFELEETGLIRVTRNRYSDSGNPVQQTNDIEVVPTKESYPDELVRGGFQVLKTIRERLSPAPKDGNPSRHGCQEPPDTADGSPSRHGCRTKKDHKNNTPEREIQGEVPPTPHGGNTHKPDQTNNDQDQPPSGRPNEQPSISPAGLSQAGEANSNGQDQVPAAGQNIPDSYQIGNDGSPERVFTPPKRNLPVMHPAPDPDPDFKRKPSKLNRANRSTLLPAKSLSQAILSAFSRHFPECSHEIPSQKTLSSLRHFLELGLTHEAMVKIADFTSAHWKNAKAQFGLNGDVPSLPTFVAYLSQFEAAFNRGVFQPKTGSHVDQLRDVSSRTEKDYGFGAYDKDAHSPRSPQ